jgi:hypothetical protein
MRMLLQWQGMGLLRHRKVRLSACNEVGKLPSGRRLPTCHRDTWEPQTSPGIRDTWRHRTVLQAGGLTRKRDPLNQSRTRVGLVKERTRSDPDLLSRTYYRGQSKNRTQSVRSRTSSLRVGAQPLSPGPPAHGPGPTAQGPGAQPLSPGTPAQGPGHTVQGPGEREAERRRGGRANRSEAERRTGGRGNCSGVERGPGGRAAAERSRESRLRGREQAPVGVDVGEQCLLSSALWC